MTKITQIDNQRGVKKARTQNIFTPSSSPPAAGLCSLLLERSGGLAIVSRWARVFIYHVLIESRCAYVFIYHLSIVSGYACVFIYHVSIVSRSACVFIYHVSIVI